MGILADKGITDDQIRGFFATNPTADQVAKQAADLGLSKDQLSGAMGVANYGGATAAERDANINNYTSQPNSNYSFNGNGILAQARAPAAPANGTDGMQIGNTYVSKAELQKFFAEGGDPNEWAQKHGITNQDQIHQLATQARGIAGNAPTGDAALQAAWQNYRKYNPNGAGVNDYAGFVANLGNRGDAIRAGTYTGAFNDSRDYAPGGIYYGRNISYQQAGLGSRGDGSGVEGDAWATGTPGAPGANGSTGTPSGSGTPGGGYTGGTYGGSSGGSSSTTTGGGTVPWVVTPDQTVEGRIQNIIKDNNGIIQQARTHALESMNDRGTVNSSMATTASDAAAYQAAIPIAQADAATTSKAAGYNADIQNQFSTNTLNRTASMDQAQLSAATQREVARLNAETSKTIAGLNNDAQARAQQFQLANATLLNTNQQAAQAYNTGMSAINNIQNNDKMDANTKTQAIANVWHGVQMQLQVLGNVSGLNLNTQLQFAGYPGFDAQGNWVGFGASTGQSSGGNSTTQTTAPVPANVVGVGDGSAGNTGYGGGPGIGE